MLLRSGCPPHSDGAFFYSHFTILQLNFFDVYHYGVFVDAGGPAVSVGQRVEVFFFFFFFFLFFFFFVYFFFFFFGGGVF
jgi:hypothetical protein